MNSRPIAAALPASSAAGGDSRVSRPVMTAWTFAFWAAAPSGSASRLHHEEGVALALLEEPAALGVGQPAARDPLGEGGGLLAVQAAERDLLDAPEGLEARHELADRVARVELLAADRRGHQQASSGLAAQEEVQEAQGLGVEPLQVVGDEQERRPVALQRAGGRLEEPLTLLRLGERVGRREARHLGEQLGHQASELGEVDGIQARKARGDRRRRSHATSGPSAIAPSAG